MSAALLMNFALHLDALKGVERRTMPAGLQRRENSAEHSWHAALCALLFANECAFPVDARHAAMLLLVHDVAEIGAGDTFVYAPERAEAAAREALALRELLTLLPATQGAELDALWQEFTAAQTPEARFANALDRLLPLLHNLAHDGLTWREHDVRLEQVLARCALLAETLPRVWAGVRPQLEAFFAGDADGLASRA